MHQPIRVGDISVTFLQSRHETQDLLDVFEITIPPKLIYPPIPHLHRDYDETIIGMNGITTWLVEGKSIQLRPGEELFIPRGSAHAFANRHDGAARIMCILTPGLLGPEYFRDLAAVINEDEDSIDPCEMGSVMTRYGVIPLNA